MTKAIPNVWMSDLLTAPMRVTMIIYLSYLLYHVKCIDALTINVTSGVDV